MGNFKEDVARVEAFVFDVDGVMTDGGITPTPDGDFIRRYYAKDGYAIAYALREGLKICVISGGRGKMLENRLRMLGVTRIYLNCMDKVVAMEEFFNDYDINPENVIYMGDDIPDLECMRKVGIPVCPADAAMEVVEASRYVSEYNGGMGAVRDIIEQVLRAKSLWAKNLKGVLGVDNNNAQ
ncbi:MAG: HAD hydrolase family protein [Alistipes sp.]|jgi:3-deoxy-D-manno-octulosonate 8-phosphate phosphatase (KDO 8-P phosphatase)|nr:HAD hydrolase family protein [Alistipes sp.]